MLLRHLNVHPFKLKIKIKLIHLFLFFLLIKQGISAFEGNVYVLNKPVCDDSWSKNAARVICKSLGCSSNTIAIEFLSDHFGQRLSNADFILDDVKCAGNEKHIGACNYYTIHNCAPSELAGVRCIDPQKLELRGGLLWYFFDSILWVLLKVMWKPIQLKWAKNKIKLWN